MEEDILSRMCLGFDQIHGEELYFGGLKKRGVQLELESRADRIRDSTLGSGTNVRKPRVIVRVLVLSEATLENPTAWR